LRTLRALLRLLGAVLHGLHGVSIVLLRFPSLDVEGQRERVRWWAGRMLQRLGLELRVQGTFKPGAKLLVCNHVSWLDIMAVHAVCPEARFVSKAEVRQWPLVNRLVSAGSTLYIERERRRDALRVVHQMAEALEAGDTVAVFPEGTTGPGPELLPFHANLLQAAIATGTPVQPVALRYADRHVRFSSAAEYVGDTTLPQTVWKQAMGDSLVVHVSVMAPQGARHADRRALSEHLREQIARSLAEGP
jgi:1-acyl-sn-glycerol-3-phosphate acyltransferase